MLPRPGDVKGGRRRSYRVIDAATWIGRSRHGGRRLVGPQTKCILVVRDGAIFFPPVTRIGEAKNPGPANPSNRVSWGAFEAQDPRAAGFRHALAPGFQVHDGEESPNDDQGAEMGTYVLKVMTVNATAWRSMQPLLATTDADVILVQEHKVMYQQVDEMIAWLRVRGWNALVAEAEEGPNGGPSAGVAIIARAHVGLSLPPVGTEAVVPARVVAAKVEAPGTRPFVALSAYLHDGEGLSSRNLNVLKTVGNFLAAQGQEVPFVLGGDFQSTPQEIAETGFAQEANAVLVASGDPTGTCRTGRTAREIDFFYTSSGMACGVDSVDTVPRTGIKTHIPVAITFKPCLAAIRALVVRKPPPLGTERRIGPLRIVAQWADLELEARRLAEDSMNSDMKINALQQRLGQIYTEWSDRAEREVMEATYDGQNMAKPGLRGRAPVLVWRSILPERPRGQEDAEGTRWRNLANATLGLQRLEYDLRRQPAARVDADGHDHDDAIGDDAFQSDLSRIHAQLADAMRDIDVIIRDFEDQIGQVCDVSAVTDDHRGAQLARSAKELMRTLGTDDARAGATAQRIAAIRKEIGHHVDRAADKLKTASIAAWVSWMRTNIDAGARNAHRYLRLPQQWRPQPMRAPDGVLTSDPAKMVEAYRLKYARRWNGHAANGTDVDIAPRQWAPWHDAERCTLPKPSVEEIRESSKSFPHDTAVAYDGFAMRHYSIMSDECLGVLADLIMSMEAIGHMPPQLQALIMPMIGKDRGGHRAIATAISLYRLWGRIRKKYSQEWEDKHEREYFASGKGRRIQDVVWRQLVRAEAGEGNAKSAGSVLWDMASFYDTLRRARLWRMVVKHGYPTAIARLAFSYYDAPRALALEGRLSQPVFARDGVLPGCVFANALTRLYCIEPFDDFISTPIMTDADDAGFDAYVDDVVVSATGDEQHVLETVVGAAEELRTQIEQVMGCEIEVDKASVVASNPRLAQRIAARLGIYAGKEGGRASAVNLGMDYAPGRKRGMQKVSGRRIKRYANLRKRASRLIRATRAVGKGRRARRLFSTGLLPATIPDAAVNGVSDKEALQLRRTAALACAPRARGRSLALVTLLNQVPTWRAEIEVILQYARQVWSAAMLGHRKPVNGAFTLSELADKWRSVDRQAIFSGRREAGAGVGDHVATNAHDDRHHDADLHGHPRQPRPSHHDAAPPAERATDGRTRRGTRAGARAEAMWRNDGRRREWNSVRGPIGAAILSLQRLGWDMPSPFVLLDDWGEEIPLTRTSPALLAELLREATTRAIERYAGARAACDDLEFEGRRLCIDQVRQQLATDKSLTREGRAAALSTICGAVMTYSRASAGGYLVQDICPMCGCRGDTLHHRIWRCQHPEVIAARNRVAPRWLQAEVARRPATQSRWVTGFFPHPGDTWPRPVTEADPIVEYSGCGDPPRGDMGLPVLKGQIYSDGSCSQHVIKELRRAATAIVQHNPEQGGAWWKIRMAVPAPMPQSSQAAEYVALPLLQAYLRATSDKIDLASDCAGVVNACNGKGARPFHGARLYAGIVKLVRADTAWNQQVSVRKVPAHIDPRTVQGSARQDAVANGEADEEAKRARQIHPQPSPAQERELAADMRRSRLTIRTIAAVMPLFPAMPKERMRRRPVLRDGAAIHGDGGHQWLFRAGCWRCSICGTLTVKPDIDAELAHRRCLGPKRSMQAETMVARGHKLSFAEGDMKVVFCIDCGAYSARRAYGLASRCPGVPTKAGAQALARIKKGYQPWRRPRDAGRPRPRLEAAAAWSQDRGAFVEAEGGAGHGRRASADGQEERGTLGTMDALGGTWHGQALHSDDGEVDMQMVEVEAHPGNEGAPAPMDISNARGKKRYAPTAALEESSRTGRRRAEGDHFGEGDDSGQTHADGSAEEACDYDGTETNAAQRWIEPMCPMDVSDYAEAKGVGNNATGAREGPGGAREDPVTASVAPTHWAVVTGAVVGAERAAARLDKGEHARKANADRGEAANAPPSGAAAPLDGIRCTMTNRPVSRSPQRWPERLGAGPSTQGRLEHSEEGGGPARKEIARRREAPRHPSVAEVAHGGGGATSCQGGERPSEGLVNRAPSARNEWDIRDGGAAAHEADEHRSRQEQQRHTGDPGGSSSSGSGGSSSSSSSSVRLRPLPHRRQGESHRPGGRALHGRDDHVYGEASHGLEDEGTVTLDRPREGDLPREPAQRQCGHAQGTWDRSPAERDDHSTRSPGFSCGFPFLPPRSFEIALGHGKWGPSADAALPPREADQQRREVAPRRDVDEAQEGRGARPHRLGQHGEGSGNGDDGVARASKRRRVQGPEGARPIWLDPPHWLYLPHLGIGGGAHLEVQEQNQLGRVHGGSGVGQQTAAAVQIRGRIMPPGSSGAATNGGVSDDRADESGEQVAADVACGRQEARTKHGSKKGVDPHASIRISLALHAERVAKRARLDADQGRHVGPTAAQRIAAIRERVRARGDHRGADEGRAGAPSHAASRPTQEGERQPTTAIDEEEKRDPIDAASACGRQRSAEGSISPLAVEWRTIEVPKIHFVHDAPHGIRDDPAGGPQGLVEEPQDGGGAPADARVAGVRRDAAAAAASNDAWHAVGGQHEPP